MDDGIVDFVSMVIPKIENYRAFMREKGYIGNIQLMEDALAMSWLAFAVLCVVSIPLVPGRAVHIGRWFGIYPDGNREKIKFGGGVAVTLGIVPFIFRTSRL